MNVHTVEPYVSVEKLIGRMSDMLARMIPPQRSPKPQKLSMIIETARALSALVRSVKSETAPMNDGRGDPAYYDILMADTRAPHQAEPMDDGE
jgi:hypothetical protein